LLLFHKNLFFFPYQSRLVRLDGVVYFVDVVDEHEFPEVAKYVIEKVRVILYQLPVFAPDKEALTNFVFLGAVNER